MESLIKFFKSALKIIGSLIIAVIVIFYLIEEKNKHFAAVDQEIGLTCNNDQGTMYLILQSSKQSREQDNYYKNLLFVTNELSELNRDDEQQKISLELRVAKINELTMDFIKTSHHFFGSFNINRETLDLTRGSAVWKCEETEPSHIRSLVETANTIVDELNKI